MAIIQKIIIIIKNYFFVTVSCSSTNCSDSLSAFAMMSREIFSSALTGVASGSLVIRKESSRESGIGSAVLGVKQGYEVFLSDSGLLSQKVKEELNDLEVRFEEHGHDMNSILQADLVMKSPGIPEHIPLVQKIKGYLPHLCFHRLNYSLIADLQISILKNSFAN